MATELVILHTNDLHGALSEARTARLAVLRGQADLYFDSGDAVKTGNLSVPLAPEAVWPRLASARCDASCPGNRESHVLEAALAAKLKGLGHPMLCANWHRGDGSLVFPPSLVLETKGYRVGVVGVMVPMVTEKMKTRPLSAFVWSDPLAAASTHARRLRPEVDLLVLLSHLGHLRDLALAESVTEYDLVLGGHSHTVVMSPARVGTTWVCQGGSHGRYVGVYRWSPAGFAGGLREWPTG